MRTFRPIVAALTIAATSLVFAGSAGAACATITTRSITGTVLGSDRRYVDTLIGFDVMDSAGHRIGMDGCAPSGYSATIRVNPKIVAEGQVSPSAVYTWALTHLPSNAVTAWIEAYPKDQYGVTNQARYGSSMRRQIKVGSTNVNVRLPLICSQGGTTGGIHGYVFKAGVRVQPSSTRAWSREADAQYRILGWNMGANKVGWYDIPNLASSQNYDVWYTYNGVTIKRTVIYVKPCAWTNLSVSF